MSLQHVGRRVALMLALAVLSGCSSVALPKEDMPAVGADPSYGTIVAGYIKSSLKGNASYDAFEISDLRWVHSDKGWNWLVCVRFQDHGHRRTYAFFIRDKAIVNSRYAVQSDACDAQTYLPFALTTGTTMPAAVDGPGPLY
jgi:hypothetical protein